MFIESLPFRNQPKLRRSGTDERQRGRRGGSGRTRGCRSYGA